MSQSQDWHALAMAALASIESAHGACRLFEDAEPYNTAVQRAGCTWHPTEQEQNAIGMTGHQQQQHSTLQQAVLGDCQRYSIQETAADSKLIAQDPGIYAI